MILVTDSTNPYSYIVDQFKFLETLGLSSIDLTGHMINSKNISDVLNTWVDS